MGKKRVGNAAAAAPEAAPKPLSHFAHALIPPFKSKDDLTKALKATADALSSAPQAPDGAVSLGQLAGALVDRALLLHKDKDVRLRAAFCLAHALRVAAPDAPYSPAQLSDAFAAFRDAVAELSRGRTAAPAFDLCLATLETIAAVRCSVLALDLDSPEAAVGLANACFAAVAAPRSSAARKGKGGGGAGGASRPLPLPPTSEEGLPLSLPGDATALAVASPGGQDDHAAVEAAVLEILSTMLDEADELPAPLVDAVVAPLLPPHRDARPDAAACARALLRRCELKLQPAVQRLLVAAIESGGVGGSGGAGPSSSSSSPAATERAADLIAEVAATCPQALLPVLPKLQDELQVEDEGRRAGAIAIAVSLLSAGNNSGLSSSASNVRGNDKNDDDDDDDEIDEDDENRATTTTTTTNAAAAAAHPTHASLGASHAPLLDALLKRARDRSAPLRALVVKAVPGLLAGAPDSVSRSAVLAAASGRLLDLDEKVRAAAVVAICTCAQGDGGSKTGGQGATAAAAAARPPSSSSSGSPAPTSSALLGLRFLGTSSLQPLLAVGERLRDSSPGVARAAALGLLALFRAYAGALHSGEEVSSTEELVLWIPGKLLAAAAASADLRNFCVDVLFAKPPAVVSGISALSSLPSSSSSTSINPPSLLPARLSPKAVARQWTCIWMACSPVERAALCALVRARGSAAGAAAEAAAARAALRAAGGLAAAELSKANGEAASASEARLALRRLNAAVVALSVVFPWPDRSRSVSALRALIAESKDNGVARALAALAAPGTRSVDAAAAAAELVARAPQQGLTKEAARVLAARLAPSLLPPEVIPELFLAAAAPSGTGGGGMASTKAHVPAASAPDGRFAAAALSLLTEAASADASLFARAAPAVADAIAADDALLRDASLRVLAAAGGAMRRAADADAAAVAAGGATTATTKTGGTRTSPRGSKRAAGDAAEDVLDALADAAGEAAREGPPAACRTAVRALASLLPTEQATRVLRAVATRHVRHLASGAPAKALSDPRKTRVALAALGALGAVAPSVFATHAAAVSDFVMAVMLPAPASAFGKGGALAASGNKNAPVLSAGALPPPSVAAAAKAEALEDLAAALVPDASSPLVLADAKAAAAAAASSSSSPPSVVRIRMSAEAVAVADRLVPELAGLVDPDAAATDGSAAVAAAHAAIIAANAAGGGEEAEELSPAARADAAALRTGAARALLTLLKAADARVPTEAYIALSLVLQDQEADVRSAFRAALISAVDATRGGGGGGGGGGLATAAASSSSSAAAAGSRASKLAAPLALSAVDPSKQAQRQALAAMRRFVAARREAVAQQMRQRAAAAARGAGNGGKGGKENPTTPSPSATDSLLHEAPEFALTYLLQILAHHPDFPQCGPATGGGPFPAPEELAPFASMLQLAIEPMVAGAAALSTSTSTSGSSSSSSASSSRASAGAALHALCKVLRAIRGCDDATAEPATPALALLADMGLSIARVLAAKHGVPLPSNALSSETMMAAAATTTAAALFAGNGGSSFSAAAAAGDRFPGGVPLPKSLFKPADPPRPKLRDGALLPPGWVPQLADLIPVAGSGGAGGGAKKHARPRASVSGGEKAASKKAKLSAAAAPAAAPKFAAFPAVPVAAAPPDAAVAAAAPRPALAPVAAAKPKAAKPAAAAAAKRPAAATTKPPAAAPKPKPAAAAAAATKKRAAPPSYEFDEEDDDENEQQEENAEPIVAPKGKGKAKAAAAKAAPPAAKKAKKASSAKNANDNKNKRQKTLDSWTSASATQTQTQTQTTTETAAAGPLAAGRATRRRGGGGGDGATAAAAPAPALAAAERRSLRAR